MERGRRILAYLPENQQRIVVSAFKEFDFKFVWTQNGGDLLERAITRNWDGIFLWHEVPVLPSENLLMLIRNNPKLARIPIFIMDPEAQAPRIGTHAEVHLPVSMSREAISRVLRAFGIRADFDPEQTFGLGESYEQIPLADFLQIIEQNAKTGRLIVEANPNGGVIFFQDGVAYRAEMDNGLVNGEKAFYRLLVLVNPRIYFKETSLLPEEHNLQKPLSFLIMESLRIKDTSQVLAEKIGPFRQYETVTPDSELLQALPDAIRNLFMLIKYHDDIQRAFDFSIEDDGTLYNYLMQLIEAGLVVRREQQGAALNVNEVRIVNALQSIPFADGTILLKSSNPEFVSRAIRFFEHLDLSDPNGTIYMPDRNSGTTIYLKNGGGSLLLCFTNNESVLRRLIGPRRTLLASVLPSNREGDIYNYQVSLLQGGKRYLKIPWQIKTEAHFWQELFEAL